MTDRSHDEESHLEQFRARLKSLRLLQGLTQSDLAEKANISIEHVSKLERGGAAPSFKTICALAQALETEPANLFLFDPPAQERTPPREKRTEEPPLSPYITHMGSFEMDLVAGRSRVSDSMQRMLGMEGHEELRTMQEFLRRFCHPDDSARLKHIITALSTGTTVSRAEIRFVRTDSQVRHGLLHGEVERDDAGRPRTAHCVFLDVTELKRLEALLHKSRLNLEGKVRRDKEQLQAAALELSEERRQRERLEESLAVFDRLIAASKDYMAFVDHDFTYRALSNSYATIVGKSAEELAGCRAEEIVGADQFRTNVRQRMEHALRGNDVRYREWMQTQSKGLRYMDVAYHPYVLDGKVMGFVVLARDDTERKLAEEALAASEERFRLLAENSRTIIFRMSLPDGTYEYMSPAVKEISGRDASEFLNDPGLLLKSIHPDFHDFFYKEWAKILKNEAPLLSQYKIVCASGEERWVEQHNRVILDDGGNVIALEGVVADVTERKLVEEELREHEQTVQALLSATRDFVLLLSPERRIVDLNDLLAQRIGLPKAELLGRIIDGFAPPQVAENRTKQIEKAMAEKATVYFQDENQGNFLDCVAYPVLDDRGEVFRVALFIRDITKQRKAEDVLRESSLTLQALLNAATDAALIVDAQGRILDANPVLARSMGMEREELLGMDITQSSDAEMVAFRQQRMKEAAESGQAVIFQDEIEGLRYEHVLYPVTNDAGDVFRYAIFSRDITEQVKAVEELRKSEERIRFMAENMEEVVWSMDPDNNMTYISPSTWKLRGVPPEQDLGRGWFNCLTPESQDYLTGIIDQRKLAASQHKTLPPIRFELQQYHADGSTHWVETSSTPVFDDAGKLAGYVGMTRDISARKAAEEELRQSEARYRLLFENACDAIYVQDLQGNILDANAVACERLGYSRPELMNLTPWDIDVPEETVNIKDRLERLMSEGHIAFETVHRRKDGSLTPADVRISLMSLGGEPVSLAIVRDSVERKRKESMLVRARQQAEDSDRNKSELLACMSHEVRTPLNSILGLLELLNMDEGDPQRRSYLKTALKAGHGLFKTIDDILDISGIEAGITEVRQQPLAIRKFLKEALESVRQAARTKDLDLKLHVNMEMPPVLVTDGERLRKVLVSLLSYAVKSTPSGEVGLSANMAQGRDGRHRLILTVLDTGPGIDEEDQERLFSPALDLGGNDGTRRLVQDLGLSLAQRMTEALGGDIAVYSNADKGVEFTLHIPVLPLEEMELEADLAPECIPVPPGSLHILVVDDDLGNLFTMCSMLKHLGHRHTAAQNGDQALESLRAGPFDLVLMDIRLPGMDGLEVTRRIRASGASWARIPVVAVTAHIAGGDREAYLTQGMDGYLPKPVDLEALGELLRAICGEEWRDQPAQ